MRSSIYRKAKARRYSDEQLQKTGQEKHRAKTL